MTSRVTSTLQDSRPAYSRLSELLVNTTMTDSTRLSNVTPRDGTVESLRDHAALEHGREEIDIEATVLNHKGNRLQATFGCPDCRYEITEVYLLRYVERQSDGARWARNETPECNCETAVEDGQSFNEVERKKRSSVTAVAVGECNWCGERFEDVFKFQTTQ